MTTAPKNVEDLHPSLWRGSQVARSSGRTLETGYPRLSTVLPGGGWPLGTLIELLLQQSGIGELRLLTPALATVGAKPIALLQPPQEPNAIGLAYCGLPLGQLLLLRPRSNRDALWSAEQILRAGSCGALLFWQQHVKPESLLRLHAIAKSSETLFIMFRPLAAAIDASRAEVRLALRPSQAGLTVEVLKRKGPAVTDLIELELRPPVVLLSRYGRSSRRDAPVVELVTRNAFTPV